MKLVLPCKNNTFESNSLIQMKAFNTSFTSTIATTGLAIAFIIITPLGYCINI